MIVKTGKYQIPKVASAHTLEKEKKSKKGEMIWFQWEEELTRILASDECTLHSWEGDDNNNVTLNDKG